MDPEAWSPNLATALRTAGRFDGACLKLPPAFEADGLEPAGLDARQQRLLLALEQLSGSHRQILLLHYFEDRGVREIGRMLDIPRGTVLSRLHYARRSVARLLGRQERSGEAIKKAS